MHEKPLLIALFLIAGAGATAGELEDAKALFDKKQYPQALTSFTRLANAGNVEAQQQLGQMYFYGEAGAIDEAKAEAWFRKAAAKGNAIALASLALIQERVKRHAEIDYWISAYDGADLRSGKFHCVAPRIPALSKQTDETERVTHAINKWQDCYNAYVTNLNAASPLTKRIPEDIGKLMNAAELERATTYLAQLHENLAEEAKVSAKMTLADISVWRTATEEYIKTHNLIMTNALRNTPMRD